MGRRRFKHVEPSGPIDSLHTRLIADELDLHGCSSEEAEIKLEAYLARWCGTNEVVRVITGRGNRSVGAPVLRDLVRELLDGRLRESVADYTMDSGGGAFRVLVE